MMSGKILVTGSSGTIGTALMNMLLTEGYNVIGADIQTNRWLPRIDEATMEVDLLEEDQLSQLPSDIEMIVHLGAHARVHELVNDPERARENIDSTFNLLELARRKDVDKFVFASSREVYGNKDKIVYNEEETYTNNCESPYTASKMAGEALVESYGQCYGLQTCIVRFSNVYGKYDASNRVIPLFLARSINGEELTVFGSDKILDFTYIDDCVRGVRKVVENFDKIRGTTLNIASGQGSSILEVAEMINEQTPNHSEIMVEPSRTGEVSRYIADISKAEKMLGYKPEYMLSDGMRKAITWYMDHPYLLEEILETDNVGGT